MHYRFSWIMSYESYDIRTIRFRAIGILALRSPNRGEGRRHRSGHGMALGSRGRHSPISFCVGTPEEEPHAPLKNAFFSEAGN